MMFTPPLEQPRKSGREKGKKHHVNRTDKSGNSVGVRDGGSMIGGEDGRESGMAAHRSQ